MSILVVEDFPKGLFCRASFYMLGRKKRFLLGVSKMVKTEKCQVRFCRNTPETTSGLYINRLWLCDSCWEKVCDKKLKLEGE